MPTGDNESQYQGESQSEFIPETHDSSIEYTDPDISNENPFSMFNSEDREIRHQQSVLDRYNSPDIASRTGGLPWGPGSYAFDRWKPELYNAPKPKPEYSNNSIYSNSSAIYIYFKPGSTEFLFPEYKKYLIQLARHNSFKKIIEYSTNKTGGPEPIANVNLMLEAQINSVEFGQKQEPIEIVKKRWDIVFNLILNNYGDNVVTIEPAQIVVPLLNKDGEEVGYSTVVYQPLGQMIPIPFESEPGQEIEFNIFHPAVYNQQDISNLVNLKASVIKITFSLASKNGNNKHHPLRSIINKINELEKKIPQNAAYFKN